MKLEDINKIYDFSVCWQMSPSERTNLKYILSKLDKNNVAIEIGSFCGGSLRSLSQHFRKVYSCDVNFACIDNIAQFKNVEFLEGASQNTVPPLVEKINNSDEIINLVIIDADHEYDGVYNDIQNILKLKPKQEIIILIHDSWYTPSRNAINNTRWSNNPHVHFIDTDFCQGDLTTPTMTMGGLALILISPEVRIGELTVLHSYENMYRKLNNL